VIVVEQTRVARPHLPFAGDGVQGDASSLDPRDASIGPTRLCFPCTMSSVLSSGQTPGR
jgi:hypothetical protein